MSTVVISLFVIYEYSTRKISLTNNYISRGKFDVYQWPWPFPDIIDFKFDHSIQSLNYKDKY